jgi:hypothetical protein
VCGVLRARLERLERLGQPIRLDWVWRAPRPPLVARRDSAATCRHETVSTPPYIGIRLPASGLNVQRVMVMHACVECSHVSCDQHGAECHDDRRWHCREHLAVLNDLPDAFGCAQHRSTCFVDGRTFSLAGTTPCEVCARTACRTHTSTCTWCGARVCTKDMQSGRCVTCSQLKLADDIPDDVIAAVARVSGEARAKRRLVARDGSRFVVQLDLGWTRRVVITVPHGGAAAGRVIRHSIFGTQGLE